MTGLGTTVSSSDPGFTCGFQPSHKKISPRVLSYALRGKFNYRAAGRNSCGSVPTSAGLKLSETPSGRIVPHTEHHCNSVSSCPRCRQRILTTRGKEIQALIDFYLAGLDLPLGQTANREVFLLTLTFPHYKNDTLEELLGSTAMVTGLRGARSYLFGQSNFSALTRDWLIPAVNGIEVTYGLNGPHPHIHCILFVDADKTPEHYKTSGGSIDSEALRSLISRYWRASAIKSLLPCPDDVYGCDLRPGADAGMYISKWSISAEVSDARGSKDGHIFSKSVAQMEQAIVKGDALPRFKTDLSEYYNQMYGVRVHNFSRKLNFYRSMHAATKFNQVVARELGLGDSQSAAYYNESGPAFFEQLTEFPEVKLHDIIPGFETQYGLWHIPSTDYSPPEKQSKSDFWKEYVHRLVQSVSRKRKYSSNRYKNTFRYGKANRRYIPEEGAFPK